MATSCLLPVSCLTAQSARLLRGALFPFYSGLFLQRAEKKPKAPTKKEQHHCVIVKDLEGEPSSSQLLRLSADRFLGLGDEVTIKQRVVLQKILINHRLSGRNRRRPVQPLVSRRSLSANRGANREDSTTTATTTTRSCETPD